MFFNQQSQTEQDAYIDTLKAVGSLSKLFSDSEIPYLYYRSAENVFCLTLDANNLSRGDITFDAVKDKVGIALKTFQQKNGNSMEKVAEFNDAVEVYQGKSDFEIMQIISALRNERIEIAKRMTEAESMIYHLVTRKEGSFEIHEEELNFIDMRKLKLNRAKCTNKVVWFSDGIHEYKFSKSKSTLYKRFKTKNPIIEFNVDILDDPYSLLLSGTQQTQQATTSGEELHEYVVLPLYAPSSKTVKPKSGLNQWNAKGRKRDEDEMYIPIPSWIHKDFEGFFPYDKEDESKESFSLQLPNGKSLKAKVCQDNGKALMSDPNADLGLWLLRHVLRVKPGELVTDEHLAIAGIDSVVITKLEDKLFKIDFAETGTFEEFKEKNKS